ncbi:MAG: HlyD family type I secretion periplasmic adaptor subunit [Alphaproteobacteria bacterium]|nr:HlyD family type I secretion periplasmic adaptor subunit [Alphaproteobacteria bacterium]
MASPSEQSRPIYDDKKTINDADEWQGVRENWAKEQAGKMHARALAVFDTDDDMPLSRHLLLMAITSFFVIFIVWANVASLDEVTRGDGKVIPSSDIQALQSLDAGVVEKILVREGDLVEAGQALMQLDQIEAESDLGANKARYLGLLASITRLSAEAEGKGTVEFPQEVMKGAPQSVTEELNAFRANQQSMNGQRNVLQQQMSQRESELREVGTRIADTRGVIALQRQEAAMVRPLVEKGSAPKMELLQLERTIKEKNAELNSYTSSVPRIKASIEEARGRIAELETNMKAQAQAELSAKLIEMNEIKERLAALKQRKGRTVLKSPVNGTIQEITVSTIGGVVRPGEDIIKIVPKDDQLIVEAKVSPKDRAFIFPGQKAVIKLTAYDFSIYGGLDGKLVDISADTIEDQEGNSFYRVKLRTDKTELVRKGEVLPITTGMVASVDILTGKKTVMQYLLKPFIKTLDNAMNER